MTSQRKHENQITDKAWQEFVMFLKNRHGRITPERQRVFRQVFQRHDHFRADELVDDLLQGPRRVSRGTVYRTLALMVQAGFVREVRDSDIHVRYEHIYGHQDHEHMICEHCGRFLEFTDPTITSHLERICQDLQFRARTHRIVIFGTCHQCAHEQSQQDDGTSQS